MSAAAQRRAWNDAMRRAGNPPPAARGGAAATRRRRPRRDAAKKASAEGNGTNGGPAGATAAREEREYRVALRMDALEGATTHAHALRHDDDDEFDELEEERGEGGGGGGKRKRKGGHGGGGGATKAARPVPKYLRPRSLASVLVEEAGRADSVARGYVDAAVRRRGTGPTADRPSYPARKFCPVTGLFGIYTEPKSGIPYATLSALEQIRERSPPWMSAASGGGGVASYWEAVKSLQNNA